MVRAAALGFLLLATPTAAQDIHGHLQQWEDHQLEFESRGLTRDFWLLAVIMYEGMWVSGYCRDYELGEDRWEMPENAPDDIRQGGQRQLELGMAAAERDHPSAGDCA